MRQFFFAANMLVLLVLAVAAVSGIGGMPLLAGAAPPKAAEAAGAGKSRIAVFNMVKVMMDYGKARYQVYQLTAERKKLSEGLNIQKAQFSKVQKDLNNPQNAQMKEELENRQLELKREIDDKTRGIDLELNAKSSLIISELYDDIKAAVDTIAGANDYDLVFAYPDATNADDMKSAYMKELKLKPPAAAPFYVAKRVDLTEAVIKELNQRNPAPAVPKQ